MENGSEMLHTQNMCNLSFSFIILYFQGFFGGGGGGGGGKIPDFPSSLLNDTSDQEYLLQKYVAFPASNLMALV